MTTLFAPAAAATDHTEKPSLLAQLKQATVVGGGLAGGLAGGGTILWAAVEMWKSEPDKIYHLLIDWGPQAVMAILGLSVFYAISMALIRARSESDIRMAAVLDRLAIGQERIATAAETAASKDDRQTQQLEVLVSTVVVQSKRVLRKLHAQDRALERLEDKAGINRPKEDEGDEELDT